MRRPGAALCAAFALCASQLLLAQAPSQLRSAPKLREDPGKSDSWTYRNPRASIAGYQRFSILPTNVYSSPTARWGSTTPAQRARYAAYMTNALRTELGKSFEIVERPGPGVASMRLTLLGVETTTKVAATVSRATPLGLAFHGVKSLAGKQGSFTGSAQVALEITDSRSGELLFAAVRRRSPDALDIKATLSTEQTVEAVADDIASSVRKALERANGR